MDLKVKDVADLLNVSEKTIHRWLNEGKIPFYQINQQFRFNRNEIEDWVLSQKIPDASSDRPTTTILDNSPIKGGVKQFSLFRALHKGDVLADIPGNNKEEVIRHTMQRMAENLNLDADVISELLLDREKLQSTALNHGIGIPHTRDFLLSTHYDVVTVAYPEKPIPYGALDGKPVHTLFFLFACDDKRHLHLLAKIAHLMSQSSTLDFLKTKPNKNELLNYIKTFESTISLNAD
jgi:PTS system nitrogen regulatory IIA component